MTTRVIRRPVAPQLQPGLQINEGLIGFWPLQANTIQGGVARDLSRLGNSGTLIGGPLVAPGPAGQSLSFNGSSGCAYLGSPLLCQLTAGSVRVICSFAAFGGVLVYQDGGGFNAFALTAPSSSSGTLAANVGTNAISYSSTKASWSLNTYYDVVVTWSASSVNCFINGVLDSTFAGCGGTNGPNTSFHTPTQFARYQYNGTPGGPSGSYFNGTLCGVRFYNRQLSAAEIYQLWASQSPTFGLMRPKRLVLAPPSSILGVSWADSLAATDQFTSSEIAAVSLSDLLIPTDQFNTVAEVAGNWNDTIAPTDSFATGAQANANWADTVAVSDAFAASPLVSGTWADTITPTDAYNNISLGSVGWQDTIAPADSIALSGHVPGNAWADVVNPSDNYTVSGQLGTGWSDAISATDSFNSAMGGLVAFADVIVPSDEYAVEVSPIAATWRDAISPTDLYRGFVPVSILGEPIMVLPSTRNAVVLPATRNVVIGPDT